jgi:putative spermidine/putrescine transport system permease protein
VTHIPTEVLPGTEASVPGSTVAAASAPKTPARRARADLLGLLPFTAYVLIFLGAPTVSVIFGAFQDDSGKPTFANITAILHKPYAQAFAESIEISLLTAVIGAVLGLLIAFAVTSSPADGVLRHVVSTASGVLAYFGGVPLAFAFIATLGGEGLVTKWLADIGVNVSGSYLFGFSGITLVYLYFQIPLMVLVIFPALEGIRPQWTEAARNLGASRLQYWRLVGGPLLFPPFLGALMLLFANAFASYATAEALTNGVIPLVPIQIGSVMSGNVAAGQENLGNALGFGMIVVVALAFLAYAWAQRRSARWMR